MSANDQVPKRSGAPSASPTANPAVVSHERREMLKRVAKFSAYTAPALLVVLTAQRGQAAVNY
jgi:hypothetical protein